MPEEMLLVHITRERTQCGRVSPQTIWPGIRSHQPGLLLCCFEDPWQRGVRHARRPQSLLGEQLRSVKNPEQGVSEAGASLQYGSLEHQDVHDRKDARPSEVLAFLRVDVGEQPPDPGNRGRYARPDPRVD